MAFGDPSLEVWGLTGGVASGKSSVARLLEQQGFAIIDADQVSHELSAPGGAAYAAIVQAFGTADRAELRKLVFADKGLRLKLEGILHPLIQAESGRRIVVAGARQRSGGHISPDGKIRVFYEAALLVETGLKTGSGSEFAGLIVVEAPADLRRAWLCARDHTSPDAADRIMAAQLSDAERRKRADHLIVNAGSLEELRQQILGLLTQLGWI